MHQLDWSGLQTSTHKWKGIDPTVVNEFLLCFIIIFLFAHACKLISYEFIECVHVDTTKF